MEISIIVLIVIIIVILFIVYFSTSKQKGSFDIDKISKPLSYDKYYHSDMIYIHDLHRIQLLIQYITSKIINHSLTRKDIIKIWNSHDIKEVIFKLDKLTTDVDYIDIDNDNDYDILFNT